MKTVKFIILLLFAPFSVQAENLTSTIDGVMLDSTGVIRLWGQLKDKDAAPQDGSYQAKVCWHTSASYPTPCDNAANIDTVSINYANNPWTGVSGNSYTAASTTICVTGCNGINYIIPTGTVGSGSISPRDGTLRWMYIRLISKINPGVMRSDTKGTAGCVTVSACSGDIITDGSPVPFKYVNSTFDRFPVVAPTGSSRLTASQVAVLVNTQEGAWVNGTSAGALFSCTVGGTTIYTDADATHSGSNGAMLYYMRARGIPCDATHVYSISTTVPTTSTGSGSQMSNATFTTSVLPTLQSISSTIQFLVLGMSGSSVVGATTGVQSMNYTIATAVLNFTKTGVIGSGGTACVDLNSGIVGQQLEPFSSNGGATITYTSFSPLFNNPTPTPRTDTGWLPNMFLLSSVCASCTTTSQNTFAWVPDFSATKLLIDNATSAIGTNPSTGIAYFPWVTGLFGLGRSIVTIADSPNSMGTVGTPNTVLSASSSRLANSLYLGSATSNTPQNPSATNILYYQNANPTWNFTLNPTFITGAAFAYTSTSTAGGLPYDGNQGPSLSWLNPSVASSVSNLATGTYGSTVEPCQSLQRKMPLGEVFVPYYTTGFPLGPSAWASVRTPGGGTFIGDPLAAPFTMPSGSTTAGCYFGGTFSGVISCQ